MSEPLPVICRLQKKNGIWVPADLQSNLRHDQFLQGLEENDIATVMFEKEGDDGSHAQLNYFHKLCRIISEDTGQGLEDYILSDGRRVHGVKSEAKIKAGLWRTKTELRSCSSFSKADYTSAIAGAVSLAEDLGINIHSL